MMRRHYFEYAPWFALRERASALHQKLPRAARRREKRAYLFLGADIAEVGTPVLAYISSARRRPAPHFQDDAPMLRHGLGG